MKMIGARLCCITLVSTAFAMPAYAGIINTIGVASNAGSNDCTDAPLPDRVQGSGPGTIREDRTLSRSAGNGSCEIQYSARAGGGSVGLGMTQFGENTGSSDDFILSVSTQFDLMFDIASSFGGSTIDISTSAFLSGQLGADGVNWNGGSNLNGSIFLGGVRGNSSVQTTRTLPRFRVVPGLGFNTLNVANTYDTDTITIDPTQGVTVRYTLTGTTGGFAASRGGEYTVSISALDSLGLALGQTVLNGLPDGISLRDDPALGIAGGRFVGFEESPVAAVPLPPTALLLMMGGGLLALRDRRGAEATVRTEIHA